ncbi:MAG TPA: hypothetical protein VFD43_12740, partial [Planctomycetota bacterium]|nr:hypothetical protein [Planctomycetota bacterium]
AAQTGQPADPGGTLTAAGLGLIGGVGGFKVGRMLAAGQLRIGSRRCSSCGAKRTSDAAFCESCHRRD